MITAGGFNHSAFTIHVPWPRPIGETVIWAVFFAPFWRHVEKSVDPKEFFAAATKGRIRVKDLTVVVLVEHTIAGEILNLRRPFWHNAEIVARPTGSRPASGRAK